MELPLLFLFFSFCQKLVTSVDVSTEYGIVRGQTVPVYNGLETVDVNSFKGVPFGKSTEGERRFLVRK